MSRFLLRKQVLLESELENELEKETSI